jgi:polyphosphate kinase
LMYRNLSRRVEVLTPVKDAQLRAVLKDRVLAAYLQDNVNARELRADGTYVRVKPAEGDKCFDSQMEFETVEFSPLRRDEAKSIQSQKSRPKKPDEAASTFV